MSAEIDELLVSLKTLAEQQDWQALGQMDERVREVVSRACAEENRNVPELNAKIAQLQALYRQVIGQVEAGRSETAKDATQARRQLNAARSYLDNARK